MSVTKKEVEHIAELARLKFSDEELESYTEELNQILAYVEKLNELDTENVEPLSYPIENENTLRKDETKECVTQKEALKNAPRADDKFFKVPKVIT
ncbi:MAG: asparaginyl/glutamyl-tRNA amidotransferase subunit C [Ignavibacteria bacterium CG2_30_36_16]|nr:Asp-tRNA(Asn)/Glu-tRNA(Gln) amidotransferase subunit GatC [Ignavibacteria bacterium]OIP62447.1 MAG: asparaginyl/glutamyl-tRNA amidotransferase subunit C [Ignavibacteria bacterium CG2_30_36_16]PJA99748.1 MAG: Asp-tRNA(Asn)/Glu-tRNA(Gln) amidotransferase GatCAB subunit C [Ignavibacteria bacterium CG_4_9_14_3_um_filter_36_18]